MKKIDVIGGLDRLIEAAAEKFNTLCEEEGYDPEDPILTGEEDGEEGDGENEEQTDAQANKDENVMPTPDGEATAQIADGMPAQAAEANPVEGGQETVAQEVPQMTGVEGAEIPQEGAQQLTPEEEEQLKAQQQQAAQ